MIVEFPFNTGGLQDRLIWVDETPVAVSFIGGVGTVATKTVEEIGVIPSSTESSRGVADAVGDSSLEPNPSIAETAKE